MLMREIHDPKTLREIAKEAKWIGKRCVKLYQRSAYNSLAAAVTNLAIVIETGRTPRATCGLCGHNLALKTDGTFRFHNGCKGDGRTPEETSRDAWCPPIEANQQAEWRLTAVRYSDKLAWR